MGYTLSVTTGFGFAVPPKIVTAYNDAAERDEDEETFYDLIDRLIDAEPLLEFDLAAYYDYTPDDDGDEAYVVFLKSMSNTVYGAAVTRPQYGSMPGADEFNALHRVAEKLGYKNPEFEFLTVVSYG